MLKTAHTDERVVEGSGQHVLAFAAGDGTIAFCARRSGLTISRIERHGGIEVYVIQK